MMELANARGTPARSRRTARGSLTDCLLLVERGVSEPDLVKRLLTDGYRRYFRRLREEHAGDAGSERLFAAGGERPVLADYGLATRISLTSVVLGTELHRAGLTFEVIDDDDVAGLYQEVIVERLPRCRMVALSTTYTVQKRTLLALLELIRRADPEIPVLIGGQGLLAWRLHEGGTETLCRELAAADALFFGEAEGTFAELVRRLAARRRAGDVPGAVDLRGAVPPGDAEPVEVDLDRAALPDWTILRRYPFNDGALARHGLPAVASLEEGRGCSFRCRFCSYPLYAGFRRKSPERVVAELAAASAAGFHTAAFCGAEFLNPIAVSRQVFEAIAEARLPLAIWAYARLDLVGYRPVFAELMDRANFRNIQFGMESGDRGVLKAMGKNYDPAKMAAGTALLRRRGIAVYASLILGYPGETDATVANTLAILEECDFEHVILHALNVVPGSPLWHRRHELGLEVNAMGFWSHRTMSLREVPGLLRHLVVELGRRTRSLLNNITQNFTHRFFDGPPSLTRLEATSRVLQRIIEQEWRPGGGAVARGELWRRLAPQVDHVPPELSGTGTSGTGTTDPPATAGPFLPLHPLGV